MIYLITNENKDYFRAELFMLYRSRFKTFYLKNHWDLNVKNGLEIDQFDNEYASNLVYINDFGRVAGGVRLISTTQKHMFSEVFQSYVPERSYTHLDTTWESSRFFIDDLSCFNKQGASMAKQATYELLIAMNELSLSWGINKIVTFTDCRLERLFRIMGFPLERLGIPQDVAGEKAVSGYWLPSEEALKRLREKSNIRERLLWGGFPIKNPRLAA